MKPRRRLAWALVVIAASLLVGRLFALLLADAEWYGSLDALSIWQEKMRDLVVIHLTSAIFSALFALLNVYAIRRSIVSLAFPRRLGNVEFGEEVPVRSLDFAAFALSAAVALVMSFAVPDWQQLAQLRMGAHFGESDPFFQMDLSFYTSWLPLESSVYVWFLVLLVLVSGLVIGLYALTPSLRWHRGAFRVSVRVRRHLSVLASFFLLTMAWSYRLDAYTLLVNGSGPEGMFSYVDHQWLLPAYLSLAIGTVAAAALVLVSGLMGSVRAGFFTVSAVLVFSVSLDLVLPSAVRRLALASTPVARERPYAATRSIFTARAYDLPRGSTEKPAEVTRFASFDDSARIAKVMSIAKDSALVYPGAYGAALVRGARNVPAPVLGSGLRRLANAWAEQRLDLLWSDAPSSSRIARRRDVKQRLNALLPVFAPGSSVTPGYLGDTLTWIVEMYSASDTYPLSRHFTLAGADRTYFRHSGTALVNSLTGRVVLVPATPPDPIAATWRASFPANIRAGSSDLLDALTATPRPVFASARAGIIATTDSAFRNEVSRLYLRMRGALAAGDLKAFGAAYDSLGLLVER